MKILAEINMYHVEVKEDEEGLGIIIDIFHNHELVHTHTYWNDSVDEKNNG